MSKTSMTKCDVNDLTPGMILAKDVQSARGAILLPANIVLTDYTISKLQVWRIDVVDIVVSDGIAVSRQEAAKEENADDIAFFDMYLQAVENIGAMFEQMRVSKKIPLQEYNLIAEGILEQTVGVHGVLVRLREVKRGDNYTYNHSLNVGIYAVLLGTWLGYDEKSLRHLAMAACCMT